MNGVTYHHAIPWLAWSRHFEHGLFKPLLIGWLASLVLLVPALYYSLTFLNQSAPPLFVILNWSTMLAIVGFLVWALDKLARVMNQVLKQLSSFDESIELCGSSPTTLSALLEALTGIAIGYLLFCYSTTIGTSLTFLFSLGH